jgi:hypothetical protein
MELVTWLYLMNLFPNHKQEIYDTFSYCVATISLLHFIYFNFASFFQPIFFTVTFEVFTAVKIQVEVFGS